MKKLRKTIIVISTLMMAFGATVFTSAFSQSIQKETYYIFFDSDKSNLDQEDKQVLANLYADVQSLAKYEVTITAHTDHDGANSYNDALSKRRASAVTNHLSQLGLRREWLSTGYFGESKPIASNQTTSGKQKNRRVEIQVKKFLFEKVDDLFKVAQGDDHQSFKLNSGSSVVTAEKGTSFEIPNDAFMTASGELISNEEVVFVVEEYQSQKDAILNGLSTQSGDQIIFSGGMFQMEAYARGEQLKLREGKSIDVTIPSKEVNQEMEVFTPTATASGITAWQSTSSSFVKKDEDRFTGLKYAFEPKELEAYLVKEPKMPDYRDYYIDIAIPVLKDAPHEPRYPSKPAMVTDEAYYSRVQRFFIPASIREKKINSINEVRMNNWEKRLHRYKERLLNYEVAKAKYPEVYAAYEQEVREYKKAICAREDQIRGLREGIIASLDARRWNQGVQVLINRSINETETMGHPKGFLNTVSNRSIGVWSDRVVQLQYCIMFLNHVNSIRPEDALLLYSKRGKLDILQFTKGYKTLSKRRGEQWNGGDFYGNLFRQNEVAKTQLADAQLGAILDASHDKAMQALIASGKTNKTTVNYVYSASFRTLGKYNCDRFSRTPQRLMAKLEFDKVLKNYGSDTRTVVCFKDQGNTATLYPYVDGETGRSYLNVPIGQELTILEVSTKGGKAYLGKIKYKVKRKNKTLHIATREVDLQELAAELSDI